MHQIYFDQRKIVICSKTDNYLQDHQAVILTGEEHSDLADIPDMFDRSKQMATLYIPSDNPDAAYCKLASHFTHVNAAGGIVENPEGEYLFIFRNGVWDLPKGKQEDGEDIALTAVREVEEECGIKDIVQEGLICITHHTYHRDGKFYLKDTYWYRMTVAETQELTPQLEEDITSAVWVKREDISECMKNTYPSIKEVISRL